MNSKGDTAQIGEIIGGRYEILGLLGKGGFGVVYRALFRDNGREFALKTWIKSSMDRRAIARFRQESEIWIALGSHPYLVQAHFVDEIDGRLYVGLELIQPSAEGFKDLDDVIKSGSASTEDLLTWGVQMCLGMEYAALRGIRAHRDLKPANVMLDETRTAKINDFGLATQPEEEMDISSSAAKDRFRGQTMHGIGFGTPTHMPPEQFDSAATCDARSDIYATGVILHQLAFGTLPVSLPWPSDTSLESRLRYWRDMKEAHLSFRYEPKGHMLDKVLSMCLASDPAHRYQGFNVLRGDLEILRQSQGLNVIDPPLTKTLSVKGWVARGRNLMRIGRYGEALHAFGQSLLKDPESALGLQGKADTLLALNRPHLAQPIFDSLLKTNPGNTQARIGKVECLLTRGYPRDALDSLKDALDLGAEDAGLYLTHGNILRELNHIKAAQESYDRALSLSPNHVEALVAKANVLIHQNEPEKALVMFDRALGMNPLHPGASRGQAACLVATGKFHQASRLYYMLEQSGDIDGKGYLLWIEAMSRRGHPEKAWVRFSRVQNALNEFDVARIRPQLLVDRLLLTEALESWQAAHARGSSDISCIVQGQVLMTLLGLEHGALEMAGHAFSLEAGHEAACAVAVGAAIRVGQDEEALQACLYGLSFHPESTILRFNKGVALAALGKQAEAGEAFAELATERSISGIIRQSAFHNQCTIQGRPVMNETSDVHTDVSEMADEPYSILTDDMLSTRVRESIRIQANGWHPRYRLPHLRPCLYIFPRILPHPLTN